MGQLISVGPIRASSVVVCELREAGVPVRVELFGVLVNAIAVMNGPGWDEERGVLWNQHALIHVI